MRFFTHYHRPMGGSEGFEAVARYAEKAGLATVWTMPVKTTSDLQEQTRSKR